MPSSRRRGRKVRPPKGVSRDDLLRAIHDGWKEAGPRGSPEQIETFLELEHPEILGPLKIERTIEARLELYRRNNPHRPRPEPVLMKLLTPNLGMLKVHEIIEINPDGASRQLSHSEVRNFGKPAEQRRSSPEWPPKTDLPIVHDLVVALVDGVGGGIEFPDLEPLVRHVLELNSKGQLSEADRKAVMIALAVRAEAIRNGAERVPWLAHELRLRRRLQKVEALLKALAPEGFDLSKVRERPKPGSQKEPTFILRFSR
jgi:hypothetical protein